MACTAVRRCECCITTDGMCAMCELCECELNVQVVDDHALKYIWYSDQPCIWYVSDQPMGSAELQ